jgi:hypothetical protein
MASTGRILLLWKEEESSSSTGEEVILEKGASAFSCAFSTELDCGVMEGE